MSEKAMDDEEDPILPQLDDMIGSDPKKLRLCADVMKLIDEELLEGEDWGTMKGLADEIRALRARLLKAAKMGEVRP